MEDMIEELNKVLSPSPIKGKIINFKSTDLTLKQWLGLNIRYYPTELLELVFALDLVVWGLWISIPWFDSWDKQSSLYRGLLYILPDEGYWGSIAVIVGLISLYGQKKNNLKIRFQSAMLMSCLWSIFSITFLISDWRSVAFIWYATQSALAFWIYKRVHEKYDLSRDKERRIK